MHGYREICPRKLFPRRQRSAGLLCERWKGGEPSASVDGYAAVLHVLDDMDEKILLLADSSEKSQA